jgi:hypothetical protein
MDSNKFNMNHGDKALYDERGDQMNNSSNRNGEDSNADSNIYLIIGKRRRRSKKVQEGRNFACSYCDKSYLSQIALTNHVRGKHKQNEPDNEERKRGRPRKNVY